jgi:hypothetical protein
MIPIRCALACAGLLFLPLVAPLAAQTIPSPYRYIEERQEVGVFVGHLSSDQGLFGYAPAPGMAVGVRYGLELAGPLGLEGIVTSLPTTRDVLHPGRAEGDRKIAEADALLTAVEARLRFALTGRRTWHGLQPYVSTGIGIAFDAQGYQNEDDLLVEGDRFDFGTRFTGSLGGGARVLLGSRLALRAEATMILWKLGVPDGFRDEERGFEDVPDDEWVNNGGLSLGLAWRW